MELQTAPLGPDDALLKAHEEWQAARRAYFDRLDTVIGSAPMDWERMTAIISTMDQALRDFVAASRAKDR